MEEKRLIQEDEIDLVELVRTIWARRWFVAKLTSVFVFLGLVVALTSPKEYSTSCTLIPEALNTQGNLGGSLGGLASLAGIDLNGASGSTGTINPGLYQSVAQSTPFLLSLLEQRYFFSEEKSELSIREYYEQYYKTSFFTKVLSIPRMIIGFLKPKDEEGGDILNLNNFISLTRIEESIVRDLQDRIQVTLDYDLNVVTIEVEMQDPLVTAQLAQFAQDYITNYVTAYSISKSREQLKFIENQYDERKSEFKLAQLGLAKFRDRNRNISTSQARSEEERLQSEYNLAFNVYNQLAQQRETIKLSVNENTPVFTILEPVKIPVEKSKPKRALILIGFTIIGGLIGVVWVLLKTA